jgi:hypothetical protein
MSIKESLRADIEEGQRLRGWITNAYAQIEFLLGDLILRCREFPEYAGDTATFTHSAPKRVRLDETRRRPNTDPKAGVSPAPQAELPEAKQQDKDPWSAVEGAVATLAAAIRQLKAEVGAQRAGRAGGAGCP